MGLALARKLQKLIDKCAAEIAVYSAQASVARERLEGVCDHPNPKPYPWEHDDGYGRQTMFEGLVCRYCGAVDLWNRGRWVRGSDVTV